MMEQKGPVVLDAGVVKFTMRYVKDPPNDQGVFIEVLAPRDGVDVKLLRFACFDQDPHYCYTRADKDERMKLDPTTSGHPLSWTFKQLRTRLPAMVERAGYSDIASALRGPGVAPVLQERLDALEGLSRETALTQRRYTKHKLGDEIIEAGNIRFGLEYRSNGAGLTIHLNGEVAGQEIELIAFDCFDKAGHYHYGPRNQDVQLFWDYTVVPDPLLWTLEQMRTGKLPAMIQRAGYPGIVASMDNDLVVSVVEKVLIPRALALREEGRKKVPAAATRM